MNEPKTQTDAISEETPNETPEGYTPEQWATFLEWTQAHPYGDQDENGIDLSLLRANLKLTPSQRLARLQSELDILRRWKIVRR